MMLVFGSPAYWEKIKRNVFALIRQLGQPTLFVTLTSAEKRWPELLQVLYKYHHHILITFEEAMYLSDNVKTELIRNDPVLCAEYFQYKNNQFMNCLRKEISIFRSYQIVDSYERVEIQKRGSPHEHKMLWLKDAPKLDMNNFIESNDKIVEFVNKFITCKNDRSISYITYQDHHHTSYGCMKEVKKGKKGMPFPYSTANGAREKSHSSFRTK